MKQGVNDNRKTLRIGRRRKGIRTRFKYLRCGRWNVPAYSLCPTHMKADLQFWRLLMPDICLHKWWKRYRCMFKAINSWQCIVLGCRSVIPSRSFSLWKRVNANGNVNPEQSHFSTAYLILKLQCSRTPSHAGCSKMCRNWLCKSRCWILLSLSFIST